MPVQVRYQIFTSAELCEAASGHLGTKVSSRLVNARAKIEKMTPTSVVISFDKNEFAGRGREVVTMDRLVDALEKWCRSTGNALQLPGQRHVECLGTNLCVRTATNVPQAKIEAFERMILECCR